MTRLIATSDFHFGLGNKTEVLRAGDEFSAPGTGQMNATEHARSLVRSGCCLPASDEKAPAAILRWQQHRAWAEQFVRSGGAA